MQRCQQSLLQVVGHIDGVHFIRKEGVPEVDALLLPAGVDGDGGWV